MDALDHEMMNAVVCTSDAVEASAMLLSAPPTGELPRRGRDQLVAWPEHWIGGAWFSHLVDFDSYGGLHTHDDVHGDETIETKITRWRCKLPSAPTEERDGEPCGRPIMTRGAPVSSSNKSLVKPGLPAEFSSCDIELGGEDAIGDHLRAAHGVTQSQPAYGWSTALVSDLCAHRAALLALLCGGYCFPVPWCHDEPTDQVGAQPRRAHGMACALDRSSPAETRGRMATAVFAADPDHVQCEAPSGSALFLALFSPLLAVVAVFAVVGTLCTLGGLPCDEDTPVVMCMPCFLRRRRFVRVLGLAEHEPAWMSRCIVLFCCPCSELQQFRELRNSGIWPGLSCCVADDQDAAAMAPARVRQRYAESGRYGAQCRESGPHGADAARITALMGEFGAPRCMTIA